MRRSDDALATIALVSRLCADDLQPLKASEFWKLMARPDSRPSELLGMGASDLTSDDGISTVVAERLVALLGRATSLAFEIERLQHSGIKVITPFDEHYPNCWSDRLGAKAPPLLYAAGAVELLDCRGLGVVGSRDVSPDGAEVAVAAAQSAASRGLPLVSGGARGVDQLAMNSALESGGTVVGVLADSLSRKLRHADIRAAIHDERTVMCTPYSPDAGFSAGNAMGRNKLIYAQSALTLVVASDTGKGGTWSGATEALDNKFGLVAVWRGPGEGSGNEELERRGAAPVATVDELKSLLDGDGPLTGADVPPSSGHLEQRTLFDNQPAVP